MQIQNCRYVFVLLRVTVDSIIAWHFNFSMLHVQLADNRLPIYESNEWQAVRQDNFLLFRSTGLFWLFHLQYSTYLSIIIIQRIISYRMFIINLSHVSNCIHIFWKKYSLNKSCLNNNNNLYIVIIDNYDY